MGLTKRQQDKKSQLSRPSRPQRAKGGYEKKPPYEKAAFTAQSGLKKQGGKAQSYNSNPYQAEPYPGTRQQAKPWQGKPWQGKSWQDKPRQGKSWQAKPLEGKIYKAKPWQSEPHKAGSYNDSSSPNKACQAKLWNAAPYQLAPKNEQASKAQSYKKPCQALDKANPYQARPYKEEGKARGKLPALAKFNRATKTRNSHNYLNEQGDSLHLERIAKRLARIGLASRREAELMVLNGRISVNGKIITNPASKIDDSAKLALDGRELPPAQRTRLWLYHKPRGVVTTHFDPEGRPTLFSQLPEDLPRLISIGRLDINTEGLILLTNDGGLQRALELPSLGWSRCYRVRAYGRVREEDLAKLKHGLMIDGVFYGAIDAEIEREQGSNIWLRLTLYEGKKHEVKNVLKSLGLTVNRLIRVSYGPFTLGELERNQLREVKSRILAEQLGPRLIKNAQADLLSPLNNSDRAMRAKRAAKDKSPAAKGKNTRLGAKNPCFQTSVAKSPKLAKM